MRAGPPGGVGRPVGERADAFGHEPDGCAAAAHLGLSDRLSPDGRVGDGGDPDSALVLGLDRHGHRGAVPGARAGGGDGRHRDRRRDRRRDRCVRRLDHQGLGMGEVEAVAGRVGQYVQSDQAVEVARIEVDDCRGNRRRRVVDHRRIAVGA